jgi:hypothetical protein
MSIHWKQHGSSHALYLGSLDLPVCTVVRTEQQDVGSHLYMLYSWSLPGVICTASNIEELPKAKQRAEQLLDLWLVRAELHNAN